MLSAESSSSHCFTDMFRVHLKLLLRPHMAVTPIHAYKHVHAKKNYLNKKAQLLERGVSSVPRHLQQKAFLWVDDRHKVSPTKNSMLMRSETQEMDPLQNIRHLLNKCREENIKY